MFFFGNEQSIFSQPVAFLNSRQLSLDSHIFCGLNISGNVLVKEFDLELSIRSFIFSRVSLLTRHLHVDRLRLQVPAAQLLALLQAPVDEPLHVPLEPAPKVSKHGRPAREHNVVVQRAAGVDRAVLDHLVDDFADGRRVLGVGELRVEEYLGAEEPLVAHVHRERLFRHSVDAIIGLRKDRFCKETQREKTTDLDTHYNIWRYFVHYVDDAP